MNESADLVSDLQLGIEVEAFLNTHIGKYIKERADIEIQQGYRELAQVSPHSPDQVALAQIKVWRAESIMEWLAEAVRAGRHAEAELKDLY